MSENITHIGSCHCGAVRYEVDAPADIQVDDCNCSICSRSGHLHLIVPKSYFRLLQGKDHLSTYTYDTREAKHLFCKTCGIKSFYIPRSHPEGISVNARCLEEGTVKSITITPFDGQNWEQNVAKLNTIDEIEQQ